MKTVLWLLAGAAVVGIGYAIYQQNQQSAAAGTQPLPTSNTSTGTDLGTQATTAAGSLASSALSSVTGS